MDSEPSDLPAQIAAALISIPKGLTPGVIKALDRLLGAAVDIPVAWLNQRRSRIDAQTESYRLVEVAIAKAAAADAGADAETAQRAIDVLVRKEYRKQQNREAVATAMIEEVNKDTNVHEETISSNSSNVIDDDWLNIFDRYAEDASSERLQGLWGRVLAGEIRRPGKFSARTLRFLSEFSQADALTFETFAKCAFGMTAPKKLVSPSDRTDIRELIYLESSGLIPGASGLGLSHTIGFNANGAAFLREDDLVIVFKGEPNSAFQHRVISLTPLGQELLCLVPSRDQRIAARSVALAMRDNNLQEAYLGVIDSNSGQIHVMEVLWMKENPNTHPVDGTTN